MWKLFEEVPKFKYDKNLNLNDWYYAEGEKNGYAAEENSFVMPNEYYTNYEKTEKGIAKIEGFTKVPWEDKVDVAFFRGTPTSYDVDLYHEKGYDLES